MGRRKKKIRLDDAVRMAKESEMTYAQYQAMETMQRIKCGQKEGAKGGRKG